MARLQNRAEAERRRRPGLPRARVPELLLNFTWWVPPRPVRIVLDVDGQTARCEIAASSIVLRTDEDHSVRRALNHCRQRAGRTFRAVNEGKMPESPRPMSDRHFGLVIAEYLGTLLSRTEPPTVRHRTDRRAALARGQRVRELRLASRRRLSVVSHSRLLDRRR